jgi:hypothetical protein
MLLAAAERGVKVNVIVYKEVAQILTRELVWIRVKKLIITDIQNSLLGTYKKGIGAA